ncbi:MAG TPA: TPM domain-containing protein [Balneolaceae bacterium]|nr:TPM domain-containing protein [Balneolaceae bacterium]
MKFEKKNLFAFLFLAALFVPASLFAQDLPFDYQPTGMVNDFAEIIPAQKQQQLENKLRNYRDTTTTALVVATLPDLKGYDSKRVATYLFNKWDIWYKKRFNGVLILIAPKEQKVQIEVGYGLEGAITDAMAGRIVRRILVPEFKKNDFYNGLDEATTAMIQLASGEYKGNLTKANTSQGGDTASFIIFLLFIAFVVFSSSRKKGGGKNGGRRRRTLGPAGWLFLGMGMGGFGRGGGFGGGGGGFGGFGGMGGFGSGGGGAGGGW